MVRYRQGDENRSSQYDALLGAEAKAEKAKKGIHALKAGQMGDKLPVVRYAIYLIMFIVYFLIIRKSFREKTAKIR